MKKIKLSFLLFAHISIDKVFYSCKVKRKFKFIWNPSFAVILKEPKQWEPNAGAFNVALVDQWSTSQCMVVEEQTGRDIEGDDNIYCIVLMCSKNKENCKCIQNPTECMNEVPATWSI